MRDEYDNNQGEQPANENHIEEISDLIAGTLYWHSYMGIRKKLQNR